MSVKHLNLSYTSGRHHVQNCRYQIEVSLDAPLSDQISQEFPEGHPKCALFEGKLHLILPKEIEGFAYMLEVIHVLFTFHQHIIDVYLYGAPDQIFKDFINHSLEGSLRVLKSKGYQLVAVDSPASSESYFAFIWWVHLDLIIA